MSLMAHIRHLKNCCSRNPSQYIVEFNLNLQVLQIPEMVYDRKTETDHIHFIYISRNYAAI